MRTMELQVIHTQRHTHTQAGLWECGKQRKTPAEYYQCYALLMVILCEVQSCSTQTPAAVALYSNGTPRFQHHVSWFLLDSASHSFCLFSVFFSLQKSLDSSTPMASHFYFTSLLSLLLYLSCVLRCSCDCWASICVTSQEE